MLAHFWRWLTTTAHTRWLEQEVERLQAENKALLQSLLGTVGAAPLRDAEAPKGPPKPVKPRQHSWNLIARRREATAYRELAELPMAPKKQPNA